MTDKTTLNNDTLSKTRVTVEGMMDKEKWVRPKLIVLVRGHPAESVLATCKKALPFSMPYPPGQYIVGYHGCPAGSYGPITDPTYSCEDLLIAYCDMFGYDDCYYYDIHSGPEDCNVNTFLCQQHQYCCLRIANKIIGNS